MSNVPEDKVIIIPRDFGGLWDICYICQTFDWSNI